MGFTVFMPASSTHETTHIHKVNADGVSKRLETVMQPDRTSGQCDSMAAQPSDATVVTSGSAYMHELTEW